MDCCTRLCNISVANIPHEQKSFTCIGLMKLATGLNENTKLCFSSLSPIPKAKVISITDYTGIAATELFVLFDGDEMFRFILNLLPCIE